MFTFDNEVQFWGQRIKEHMEFLYLGLVEEAINKNNLPVLVHQGKEYNLRDAAQLYQNLWEVLLAGKPYLSQVDQLIEETLEYQEEILTVLKSGIWIGWLSYSFLRHITKELLYFQDKINGVEYTLVDEANFWLWHDESEMEAINKLIDPSEVEISREIQSYIQRTQELDQKLSSLTAIEGNILDNLEEFNSLNQGLRQGILSKELFSNIAPLLISHIIKEGQRSIQIMTNLL